MQPAHTCEWVAFCVGGEMRLINLIGICAKTRLRVREQVSLERKPNCVSVS